jgi:F-type H+-transporting ATPase subunit epsilon
MKLEIETPAGTVYSDSVEMVTLQGMEGRMRISPHHMPVIAQLAPGEMIVYRDGRKKLLDLGEGFALISMGLVAVITDMAVPKKDLSAEEIAARRRSSARIEPKNH